MDVVNRNGWRMNQVVPSSVLLEKIQERWPLRAIGKNYPGEVARRYEYTDGEGEIGFISSVTEPFCEHCNRLRITAEGQVRNCLFSTDEWDARAVLRSNGSDEKLAELVRACLSSRRKRAARVRSISSSEKRWAFLSFLTCQRVLSVPRVCSLQG